MIARNAPLVAFTVALGLLPSVSGAAWGASRGSSGARPAFAVASADEWDRHIDLTYSFEVPAAPASSAEVLAWIPIPASNGQQRLRSVRVEEGLPYQELVDPEYGNRFVRFDLSGLSSDGSGGVNVTVTFRVSRRSHGPLEERTGVGSVPGRDLARFLAADRLVPIDGRIAEEARRVTSNGNSEPLEAARRLFEHITESVSYDKTGTGWGRGDALRACDVRAGNCTDFHSLFIGEARALGIPARFIMGLPLPSGEAGGEIAGYHCWAEFYVDGKGWVPLDASEASKHPEEKGAFFGGLDADRIEFTVGRDIQVPGASAPPQNYVIYPHVEVDGAILEEKVKTTFSFAELPGWTPDASAALRS